MEYYGESELVEFKEENVNREEFYMKEKVEGRGRGRDKQFPLIGANLQGYWK